MKNNGSSGFQLFGLLAILAGSVLIYALFYQNYTWDQFMQELANWTHLPIAGKTPGVSPTSTAIGSGLAGAIGQAASIIDANTTIHQGILVWKQGLYPVDPIATFGPTGPFPNGNNWTGGTTPPK